MIGFDFGKGGLSPFSSKLSEAAAAHLVSEGRHLRGKLVFKVR